MANYKCATIFILAIFLCFFHLSLSLDTIIKGKKECPETIHNTTDDIRRVIISVGARARAHSSRGARSSSGGHGYSRSSTILAGAVAAGAVAGSNNNHHPKKNSSSICMGKDFLAISLLAVILSSFAIMSKLAWV